MSDRMTAAHGPKGTGGFATYGRKTRAEMLAQFRDHYQRQLEQAQKALALTDDEIRVTRVTTYLGPWAMRNEEEVT